MAVISLSNLTIQVNDRDVKFDLSGELIAAGEVVHKATSGLLYKASAKNKKRSVVTGIAVTSADKAGQWVGYVPSEFDIEDESAAMTAGTDYLLAPGTNEQQTVGITGVPTGGAFKLTFSGQTTADIAYNAAAAAVQAALEALSNIEVGDVIVTGTNPNFTVTFAGNLGAINQPLMTSTNTFTGGTTPNVAIAESVAGVPSGDIALLADLAVGDYLTHIGSARTATGLHINIYNSGNTK